MSEKRKLDGMVEDSRSKTIRSSCDDHEMTRHNSNLSHDVVCRS